jgi:hypothetical protein
MANFYMHVVFGERTWKIRDTATLEALVKHKEDITVYIFRDKRIAVVVRRVSEHPDLEIDVRTLLDFLTQVL